MLKPSFLSDEYLVSDDGYVLSKRDGTPLKYSINHKGYAIINICINGRAKGVAVHTMVARAFCEGYQEGLTVNHKDGDKLNNNSNNLEWITSYDNMKHARTVLGKSNYGINNINHKKVKAYNQKEQLVKEFPCLIEAARYLEPNRSYIQLRRMTTRISQVALGKKKTYKGYIWRYDS